MNQSMECADDGGETSIIPMDTSEDPLHSKPLTNGDSRPNPVLGTDKASVKASDKATDKPAEKDSDKPAEKDSDKPADNASDIASDVASDKVSDVASSGNQLTAQKVKQPTSDSIAEADKPQATGLLGQETVKANSLSRGDKMVNSPGPAESPPPATVTRQATTGGMKNGLTHSSAAVTSGSRSASPMDVSAGPGSQVGTPGSAAGAIRSVQKPVTRGAVATAASKAEISVTNGGDEKGAAVNGGGVTTNNGNGPVITLSDSEDEPMKTADVKSEDKENTADKQTAAEKETADAAAALVAAEDKRRMAALNESLSGGPESREKALRGFKEHLEHEESRLVLLQKLRLSHKQTIENGQHRTPIADSTSVLASSSSAVAASNQNRTHTQHHHAVGTPNLGGSGGMGGASGRAAAPPPLIRGAPGSSSSHHATPSRHHPHQDSTGHSISGKVALPHYQGTSSSHHRSSGITGKALSGQHYPSPHHGGSTIGHHHSSGGSAGGSGRQQPPPLVNASSGSAAGPQRVRHSGVGGGISSGGSHGSHPYRQSPGSTPSGYRRSPAAPGASTVSSTTPSQQHQQQQQQQQARQESQQSIERRQQAAKLALRKQLEKTLLQIQPPKPPPPEMNFIPNQACTDFTYLIGLEEAVKKILTGDKKEARLVYSPFTCVKCGTDFTPVWKRDSPGSKNVICERCMSSNQKKALKAEHTKHLKGAFVRALQQEQEIDKRLSTAASTSAALSMTSASPRMVSSPAPQQSVSRVDHRADRDKAPASSLSSSSKSAVANSGTTSHQAAAAHAAAAAAADLVRRQQHQVQTSNFIHAQQLQAQASLASYAMGLGNHAALGMGNHAAVAAAAAMFGGGTAGGSGAGGSGNRGGSSGGGNSNAASDLHRQYLLDMINPGRSWKA